MMCSRKANQMTDYERELLRRWHAGDGDALCALVSLFMPLVRFYARGLAYRRDGETIRELESVGKCALLEGFRLFDPKRDCKLSTYLVPCIVNTIKNSPEYTRGIPRLQRKIYREFLAAQDRLIRELDRQPTLEEIARAIGREVEQVEGALAAAGIAAPDQLPDEGPVTLPDRSDGDSEAGRIEVIDDTRDLERIERALDGDKFSELEREIIALFYFAEMRDAEIAKRLDLTPGNAKVIRKRALDKLRGELGGAGEGEEHGD